MDNNEMLIKARTEQLLSAAKIRDVLLQALNDITVTADKAITEAEAIRKADIERNAAASAHIRQNSPN